MFQSNLYCSFAEIVVRKNENLIVHEHFGHILLNILIEISLFRNIFDGYSKVGNTFPLILIILNQIKSTFPVFPISTEL